LNTPVNNVNSKFDTFNVIYTNADCFTNKRDDLILFLSSLNFKPSVIIITEVNSKVKSNNMHESEFNLSGYALFSININVESHRGVIIYVDSSLDVSQVDMPVNFNECLGVQIRLSAVYSITICGVYRSPSSNGENDKHLCELIDSLSNQVHGRLLLVGDFNFRNINWTNWSVEGTTRTNTPAHNLLKCLRDNYLTQHTHDPTRARGTQTPSLLDLVISNEDFIDYVYTMSPLGKSDHSVLKFSCDICMANSCNVSKLNFNKGNYSGLREYCASNNDMCDLSNCDVSEAWSSIREVLDFGMKKFIPAVMNNNWRRKESWRHPINNGVRQLICKKHRLWTRYQETKNITIFNEYKHVRNLVRKGMRKIAQKVQSDIAQCCK